MDFSVTFNYSRANRSKAWDVSSSQALFWNETDWCNYTSTNISHSTNAPLSLPAAVVFTCRDRAWAAIPSHIKGGPCSLGWLSPLVPNTSMISQHRFPQRGKHSIHVLIPDCNNNLWLLSEWLLVSNMALGCLLLCSSSVQKATGIVKQTRLLVSTPI